MRRKIGTLITGGATGGGAAAAGITGSGNGFSPVSSPGTDTSAVGLMEGDSTGSGRGHGGRFNAPTGAPISGPQKTVTLSNGQKVTVNAHAAPQFEGFFNDLIKAGAPVHNLGGFGTRPTNPSQHPNGMAVDWGQGLPGPFGGRVSESRDVYDWIKKNPGMMNSLEDKWGMSGGEHWANPDLGHVSIDTLFGQKHLDAMRAGANPNAAAAPQPPGLADPGAGLQGSAYLAARRQAAFGEELKDPSVRREMAGIASMEHSSDPVAPMESLMNCVDMQKQYAREHGLDPNNYTLHNMIHSGFYGPVNHGLLPGRMAGLSQAEFGRFESRN